MRRPALAAVVAGVALVAGCSSPAARGHAGAAARATGAKQRAVAAQEGRGRVVRLGLVPSVPDTFGLDAIGMGYFRSELGSDVKLDVVTFGTPAAEEAALAAGRLDAAYVDPVAAVRLWQRSGGKAIRVVAGAAAGGAELVARKGVTSARDLAGRRVTAPAGGDQAAALAYWLRSQGRQGASPSGISGLSGPAAVRAFRSGRVAAAWEPAPFDAELTAAGGHVLAREPGLWPDGLYATSELVVTQAFLAARPGMVTSLLKGQVLATELMTSNRPAAEAAAEDELASMLGRRPSPGVLARSFAQVTFTDDPMATTVTAEAAHASSAGLLRRPGSLPGLYDLGPLQRLLRAADLPGLDAKATV
jgi:NitT/TauT family transport system substrate-binding protein